MLGGSGHGLCGQLARFFFGCPNGYRLGLLTEEKMEIMSLVRSPVGHPELLGT